LTMQGKLGPRRFRALAFLVLFAAAAGLSSMVYRSAVASEQLDYYGFVPSSITQVYTSGYYSYTNVTGQVRGIVAIVGIHDGTRVAVYTLPDRSLVRSLTVNRLEKAVVYLPNGTFFKATSDRPVSIILMGGLGIETGEAMISTFFTSVEGGYVGEEFIFMDVEAKTMTYQAGVWAVLPGLPVRVYAVEDSDVTVWSANGTKLKEFKVPANGYQELSLQSMEAFRLLSTGAVMVQTFTTDRSVFYPAVEGGFVGRLFYGTAPIKELWGASWTRAGFSYIATSAENAKIQLADLEFKKKVSDVDVSGGRNVSFPITVGHMSAQSDRPLLLMFKSDDNTGGMAIAGLAAGQEAYVYAPSGETYVFAYKETVVLLDDVQVRLQADGILPIPEGAHKLSASENVIIEATNYVKGSSIANFGQCLPSAQSLSLRNTDVKAKPVTEQGLPWMEIGAAAALMAVVAALLVVKTRRRR